MRNKKKMVRGIFLAAIMMSMAACGNAEETVSSGSLETENVSENGTEETSEDVETSQEVSASADEQKEAPSSEEETEEPPVSSEESEESVSIEEPEDKTGTDGLFQGTFPAKMVIYNEEKASCECLFDEDGYVWKLMSDGDERTAEYLTDNEGNKVYGHMDSKLYGGNWDDEKEILVKSYSNEDSTGTYVASYEYNEENNIITYSYQDSADSTHNLLRKYTYEETGEGWGVTAVQEQNGDKYTYVVELDGNGNVVSLLEVNELSMNGKVDVYEYEYIYEYDNDGNMVKQIKTSKSPGAETQTKTDSYTYDGAGNMLSHTWEGGKEEYEGYDGNGNWSMCTQYDENGELVLFNSRIYNEDGNIVSVSLMMGTDELTVDFVYDEEGRMLSAALGDQTLQELEYNADGLLEKVTGIYDFDFSLGGYWVSYKTDINDWIKKYTGITFGSIFSMSEINDGQMIAFEY